MNAFNYRVTQTNKNRLTFRSKIAYTIVVGKMSVCYGYIVIVLSATKTPTLEVCSTLESLSTDFFSDRLNNPVVSLLVKW